MGTNGHKKLIWAVEQILAECQIDQKHVAVQLSGLVGSGEGWEGAALLVGGEELGEVVGERAVL